MSPRKPRLKSWREQGEDHALSRRKDHARLAFTQSRLAFLRAVFPHRLATNLFRGSADGNACRAGLEVVTGEQILGLLGF